MMTLYTAIGTYKLNTSGLPTVMVGEQEYGLDSHELLLWSCLAFRILTYQELKEEFCQQEKDLHILGELGFDRYLNRLITRRLVVSGQDCTGVDALYDLMGHLHVQPIPSGMAVKTIGFLKLWLCRGTLLSQGNIHFPYGETGTFGKMCLIPSQKADSLHCRTDPLSGKGQNLS